MILSPNNLLCKDFFSHTVLYIAGSLFFYFGWGGGTYQKMFTNTDINIRLWYGKNILSLKNNASKVTISDRNEKTSYIHKQSQID